jgi:hypothetical protein
MQDVELTDHLSNLSATQKTVLQKVSYYYNSCIYYRQTMKVHEEARADILWAFTLLACQDVDCVYYRPTYSVCSFVRFSERERPTLW